jgi:hypothetical protein
VTWDAGSATVLSVAVSADGNTMVAAPTSTYVYISTNRGVTWTTPSVAAKSVAVSRDGNVFYTGGLSWKPYKSANGGSWSEMSAFPSKTWSGAATDTTGSVVAFTDQSSYIYVSTDGGATQVPRMADTTRNWVAVACSNNCSVMAAAEYGGKMWVSRV